MDVQMNVDYSKYPDRRDVDSEQIFETVGSPRVNLCFHLLIQLHQMAPEYPRHYNANRPSSYTDGTRDRIGGTP